MDITHTNHCPHGRADGLRCYGHTDPLADCPPPCCEVHRDGSAQPKPDCPECILALDYAARTMTAPPFAAVSIEAREARKLREAGWHGPESYGGVHRLRTDSPEDGVRCGQIVPTVPPGVFAVEDAARVTCPDCRDIQFLTVARSATLADSECSVCGAEAGPLPGPKSGRDLCPEHRDDERHELERTAERRGKA